MNFLGRMHTNMMHLAIFFTGSAPIQTGVIILPTQNKALLQGKSPQNFNTFALFDSPQKGSHLMTSVKTKEFSNYPVTLRILGF